MIIRILSIFWHFFGKMFQKLVIGSWPFFVKLIVNIYWFFSKLFFQCCKGTIFHIFNDFLRLLKNILFLKELIFKCQWGHENWEKCSVVDGKIRVSNVAEKHRLRRRSETADWQNDNRSIKTFIFTQNNDTKGGKEISRENSPTSITISAKLRFLLLKTGEKDTHNLMVTAILVSSRTTEKEKWYDLFSWLFYLHMLQIASFSANL